MNPDSSEIPALKPSTNSVQLPVVQVQSLGPASGPVAYPAASAPVPSVAAYEEEAPEAVAMVENVQAPAFYAPVPTAPPKRPGIVQYWQKIGGGSFMLSLLIHAGILVAAYFIVETIVQEQKVDFLPGGGSKQGQQASEQLAHQVQNKKRSTLNKSTPMKKVVSTSDRAAIALDDTPMDTMDMPEMSSLLGGGAMSGGFGSSGGAGGGFGKGIGIGGQTGFVSLPPSMKSRCSSAERLQKLKESGGSAECEKAVSTALEYLKSKQNKDGSWGTSNRCAMTGFALLCYLGRCETPESPFYGENVLKGILFLIEVAKKNPEGIFAEAPETHQATYEHGIATYAMGEMYTLARMGSKSLPGMREAFEQGVRVIIKYQLPVGGWGYGREGAAYRVTGGGDPSVTGWQYQALKAAKLTNLKIDGLHGSIDKSIKYLESIQNDQGGFGGTNREAGAYTQWTMTGVGVLGLQTLAKGKSSAIKKGIKWSHEFFVKEPPTWEEANLYSWYYFAQTFFQNGGDELKYWNETALPLILKNQAPDGSWLRPGTAAGGNKIYSTALCTLMLEVYYRYLKVGDREQTSLFDR